MTTATLQPKDFLSSLKKTDRSKHVSRDLIVIYGAPGMGKTSLAAQFKTADKPPLFVTSGDDNGYMDLVKNGQLPEGLDPIVVTSWQHLQDVTQNILKAVQENKDGLPFCAVVFENLGGFERHLRDHQVEKYQKNPRKGDSGTRDTAMMRFNEFGGHTGTKDASPDWESWLKAVVKIGEAGLRPILLGHAKGGKVDNAESSHSRIVLDLHATMAAVVEQVAGNIGYITMVPNILSKGGSAKETKVDDEPKTRILKFYPSPQFAGKNRYGISEPIEMGSSAAEAFKNLAAAMSGSKGDK